ncbi:Fidgetin-like protein 1 [Hypsibius exemplaris]|uniref:Fidgetin-like protein 1 n=1 Tax=Hypsibius exemplaris TaxID=2072580 RepID=A0A1W0XA13_HYPEX|nr:Fidgetin-like protein 1 [Hypsibius exemplaris]
MSHPPRPPQQPTATTATTQVFPPKREASLLSGKLQANEESMESGDEFRMEPDSSADGGGHFPQAYDFDGGQYTGGDFDSEMALANLMSYSLRQENLFYSSGQSLRPSERIQHFRPVLGLQHVSFDDGTMHVQGTAEEMAAYHYEQYEMYCNLMDREAEQDGCQNYLTEVADSLAGLPTNQHLWQPDGEMDIQTKFPADRQIEGVVMAASGQMQLYEQSMRAAYTALETKENTEMSSRAPTKKKPAGVSTFRAPNLVEKAAPPTQAARSVASTASTSSQQVMNNLDSILLGSTAGSNPTTRVYSKPKTPRRMNHISEIMDARMEEGAASSVVQAKSQGFSTAKDVFLAGEQEKGGAARFTPDGYTGRALGGVRKHASDKFILPIGMDEESVGRLPSVGSKIVEGLHPRLKNIDPKMVESILATMVDSSGSNQKKFDDISGLEKVKEALLELVVWPLEHPEMFTGIKSPSKGLLLFGPPGTGKTLIAKCVAGESQSTFFCISASTITSKWIGDGEKMVKALFEVARTRLPAVIFIDEVDSLLTQRSSEEHESSRRMKTEFLTQFDGMTTESEESLLVIGATNRPQEIDEAARRRFTKRLYIPLPEKEARIEMIIKNLGDHQRKLSVTELDVIGERTDGYSGADITGLCQDAANYGNRELLMARSRDKIRVKIRPDEVRPINFSDFEKALVKCKSSVDSAQLQQYAQWNAKFGHGSV